jgi:transcriptional regulator with XRE-family HTH domain
MSLKGKKAKDFLKEITGEDTVTFGGALKDYRFREEITQQELADLLEVSKSYISDIENGRKFVSIGKAHAYAQALGESEKYFLNLAIQDQMRNTGLDYQVKIA